MGNVRRWYVYIVSAITLHSVTWAVIFLLRDLLIPSFKASLSSLAFQIAVIIVGLPIYVVHWVWAQRSASRDGEERDSIPRRLYLYVMLGGFLAPMIASGFEVVRSILAIMFRLSQRNLVESLISLVVLGILFAYHWMVKGQDDREVKESEASAVTRHLFQYAFSGTGLVLLTIGVVNLLRWLMTILSGTGFKVIAGDVTLTFEIARIAVGLLTWTIFWRTAQNQFRGPNLLDRESVVRKVYLYLVVFIAVIMVVTTAAMVLSDLISGWLNVPSAGEGDIRLALSIIIGVGAAWAYHAYVLRQDAAVAEEASQQALVRRIYLFLMMTVGLAAFLIGLGGVLSVLIRALDGRGFIVELREQLSWFTASLIAGLPVWFIHWRQVQLASDKTEAAGIEERRSLVRSFYLYFYILVATITVLSGAIYIVAQLVELALGERTSLGLVSDIGQAIAYVLIAVGVWLYHGAILRQDRRLLKETEIEETKELRIAIVDVSDGSFGQNLGKNLSDKVPGLTVEMLALNLAAPDAAQDSKEERSAVDILTEAEIIIGPWSMAAPGMASEAIDAEVAEAITSSQAQKLILPTPTPGWSWMGVERWNEDAITKEVINAVKQIASGEEIRPARRMSAIAIAFIVLVSICVLTQLVTAVFGFLY